MKMNKNKFKCKSSDMRTKAYHKVLVNKIIKLQKELQRKADKKYGKGKITVTEMYASKIAGGRL